MNIDTVLLALILAAEMIRLAWDGVFTNVIRGARRRINELFKR
jgi:hypothetical protein